MGCFEGMKDLGDEEQVKLDVEVGLVRLLEFAALDYPIELEHQLEVGQPLGQLLPLL